MSVENTRKYFVADEDVLRKPIFDQSFDGGKKENSMVLGEKKHPNGLSKNSPRNKSMREFGSPKKEEKEEKKDVNRQSLKRPGMYVGEYEVVYKTLGKLLLEKRGTPFSVGPPPSSSGITPEEFEKKRNAFIDNKINSLMDFWKQIKLRPVISKPKTPARSDSKQSVNKSTKVSEKEIEILRGYSDKDIKFTISQDIIRILDEYERGLETSKVSEKVKEENRKIQEEQAYLNKAVDLTYGFGKEFEYHKKLLKHLIGTFKEMNQKYPIDAAELYQWWLVFPHKVKFHLEEPQDKVKELVNNFYSDETKYRRLEAHYKAANMRIPTSEEEMKRHLELIKPIRVQKAMGFTQSREGKTMEKIIEDHFFEQKIQKEIESKSINEKNLKNQEQKQAMVKKIIRKKEIKAHTFEELAQPKDTSKVGKTLMELEKQFPMDEIVRKMKKEEFNTNRARNPHLFRYPEEYQIYNEEEEVKRKMISHKKAPILAPQELEEKEANRKEQRRNKIEALKRGTIADTTEEKERKMQKVRDKQPIMLYLREAIQGFFKSKGKRLLQNSEFKPQTGYFHIFFKTRAMTMIFFRRN